MTSKQALHEVNADIRSKDWWGVRLQTYEFAKASPKVERSGMPTMKPWWALGRFDEASPRALAIDFFTQIARLPEVMQRRSRLLVRWKMQRKAKSKRELRLVSNSKG